VVSYGSKSRRRQSSAHGSRWWEGVDANRMIGRLLVRLDGLANELTQRTAHPWVGPPSLHTPIIKGAVRCISTPNIAACRSSGVQCRVRRRAGVLEEVQAVIDRLASEIPHFKAQAHVWFTRSPFQAQRDSALLPVLQRRDHCDHA